MRDLLPFWKCGVTLLSLVLSLVVWLQHDTKESRCGCCVVLMASLWATEALPLEVTSFLPVLLLPLLGIMTTGEVSKEYMTGANMMFLTAMGVAAAVQKVGLHRRLALGILTMTGTGKKSLLISFMAITCLISMFICNTATCAMMCPILKVVLEQLYGEKKHSDQEKGDKNHKEKIMFYLGVAYAANIGGTGTLTASEPNVIMKGVLDTMFPCQDSLTYATWFAYSLPTIVIILTAAFFWLLLLFLRKNNDKDSSSKEMKVFLQTKYRELGVVTFQEKMVTFYFLLLVIIWLFEEPEFIPGWADYFTVTDTDSSGDSVTREAVGEATPAVLILILLFLTPSSLDFWPFKEKDTPWEDVVLPPTLLDWDTVTNFFPWGLLILRGGGFALAAGSERSGLSHWIGSSLEGLSSLPPWIVLTLVCGVTSLVTEICSNAATANILLPVLGELAVTLKLNPLYLMLPATVTCCYAFMLPVSCPPNAIVYKASGMSSWYMLMTGVGLNLVTLMVNVLAANTYASPLLGLSTFPSWANSTIMCDL